MKKTILIIEDEASIREELAILLRNAGYAVEALTDFHSVTEDILRLSPDIALLDINLPHRSGKDILMELRRTSELPVIMVTSSDMESDEVLSFGYGADDYITKPYSPTLLLLRIASVLKRLGKTEDTISYRGIELDMRRSTLKTSDTEIVLTRNEFLIMSFLLQKRGSIVSRDELMTDMWDNNEYINDSTLTVNISRLRSKLRAAGVGDAIETRKGLGYILV